MTSYEEWRVTGQPNAFRGVEFPPYEFVWSLRINPHLGDPEQAAREFVAGMARHADRCGTWTDGPHLHHRTVTVTDWEPA